MPPAKLPTIDPTTGKVVVAPENGGDPAASQTSTQEGVTEEGTTSEENMGDGTGSGTGEGGGNGTPASTEVVDLNLENIEKGEDGYVWKIDPKDPKSMVYKGKTLDELFRNAAANIKEKDSYIEKLKAGRPKLSLSQRLEESEGAGIVDVEFPKYGEVLAREAQQQGISDLALLAYGDAEWDKYAEEHGDRSARRMEDRVNQVKSAANVVFQKENTIALNNYAVQNETEAVQELLDAAEIMADDPEFDYDAILASVFKNPASMLPNKVLKNGRIVAEAAKVINTIVAKRAKQTTKAQTEEEIAATRENKNRQTKGAPVGVAAGNRAKHVVPPPKTMSEALRRAKEQFLK